MGTRRELIEAVAARYRAGGRQEKKEILDEFVKVTGFHRKHAIRVLKKSPRPETREPRQRMRIYDEAVREALTIVWEAADRIWASACTKESRVWSTPWSATGICVWTAKCETACCP